MKIHQAAICGIAFLILAACAMNTLPSKDIWYARHYFIMQDFEREAYKNLSPAGQQEFQNIFWAARPMRTKQEFDRRIAYIETQFRKENSSQPWNTERARIFLLNGRPANIETRVNDSWGMRLSNEDTGGGAGAEGRSNEDIQAATLEIWTYTFKESVITYSFTFRPPNKWSQVQSSYDSRYISALESYNREQFFGPADAASYRQQLENLKTIK